MKFSHPWVPLTEQDSSLTPVLVVFLRARDGQFVRQTLIVDSGADVSMGPRSLCELLGISWDEGQAVTLRGISLRDECSVAARIHHIEVYVREARCRLVLPFCFADGDAPLLLGRDTFFDVFHVHFEKTHLLTTFERVTPTVRE